MSMPEKNVFFESLTPATHVEERSAGKNSYWVARLASGDEGVVILDGRKQAAQQKALSQMVHDSKMRPLGYRYRLSPKGGRFKSLYAKTLANVGPLMRDYPTTRFDVVEIG